MCSKCNRRHSGECKIGSAGCYKYGKLGHNQRECPEGGKYYECGLPGHIRPSCPKLQKDTSRSLRLVGGASKSGNEKKEVPKAKGRAFVMTADEAKETPDVVSGTFLVNNCYALVLFDSGADRSFVSTSFLHYLNRKTKQLEESFVVETADGSLKEINEIIEDCTIVIGGKEFPVKLMPMCLGGFDIVLGMDWLSKNKAKIICDEKMIKVRTPTGETVRVRGDRKKSEIGIISHA